MSYSRLQLVTIATIVNAAVKAYAETHGTYVINGGVDADDVNEVLNEHATRRAHNLIDCQNYEVAHVLRALIPVVAQAITHDPLAQPGGVGLMAGCTAYTVVPR